ncbi:hypothetical protein AZE42_12510 [Rhizopogon vesiculosus]|uniref:Uncharacterized protein n=1 Tax=Rhizopogon vesiculosus TaxID=180088 RepID=A0A1J8QLW7_9AGAM|nr:hypothetical protein AZE42_12510 [Rhizopogon vesiculosus]
MSLSFIQDRVMQISSTSNTDTMANSIMSCNQRSHKNPLPREINMNAPQQLCSQRVPSIDTTAPPFHSKTSCKQKMLGVSSVNTDDTLQNIQQSPPGPKSKTPQGKKKLSGCKLSVSVDHDTTPDATLQTMQLPHPASEVHSTLFFPSQFQMLPSSGKSV